MGGATDRTCETIYRNSVHPDTAISDVLMQVWRHHCMRLACLILDRLWDYVGLQGGGDYHRLTEAHTNEAHGQFAQFVISMIQMVSDSNWYNSFHRILNKIKSL